MTGLTVSCQVKHMHSVIVDEADVIHCVSTLVGSGVTARQCIMLLVCTSEDMYRKCTRASA